jgi:hypothetical protein
MKYIKFYINNKPESSEVIIFNKPSPEQIEFANSVLEILSPTLNSFGFVRIKTEVLKYSTIIIFRKNIQYIKIYGSTYPTDYPYTYNIILGEEFSDKKDINEWDWISLYELKNKIEFNNSSKVYEFPYFGNVEANIENAKNELTKYAITFLHGDMTLFYKTRSEIIEERGPFCITIIKNFPNDKT